MSKLSSAIVQRKLASLRDVEEALARQVLYGGDIATNLLEQAPRTDEQALVDLLAETHELVAAPAGELPAASDATRLLVPGDVALRHNLYPLEHSATELVVAVSEPLRPDTEHDLGFGLGLRIQQRVAPLVRVRQAISRDYGLPLDRRTLRVVAKLEGRPDPSPSMAPPPFAAARDILSLPRPPSMPPLGLPKPMEFAPVPKPQESGTPAVPRVAPRSPSNLPPARQYPSGYPAAAPIPAMMPIRIEAPLIVTPELPDTASIHERLTAPAPPVTEIAAPAPPPAPVELPPPPGISTSVAAALHRAVTVSPQVSIPSTRSASMTVPVPNLGALGASILPEQRRSRTRHRGPYTAAAAEEDLFVADSRDTVLTAFFDFTSQFFEYSALFAVHGDLAEGRFAHGPGANNARVTGIGVPLDLPSSLATARREAHFVIAPLASDGIDARFATDLKRKPGRKVFVLPILVRARTVLLLYGDHGAEDVALSQIGEVIAFAPLVATALEAVIVRKKAAVRQSVGEPAFTVRPVLKKRPVLPSREERVEALAEALESTIRPTLSERPPFPEPEPEAHDPGSITEPAIPSLRPAAMRVDSVPPVAEAIPAAAPLPNATVVGDPVALNAGTTVAPNGHAPVDSVPPASDQTNAPVFALSRKLGLNSSPGGGSTVDSGWDIPIAERPRPELPDDVPDIAIGTAEVDWLPEDEEAYSRGIPDQQIVVPAKAPVKAHSSAELRLPKVIVNVDGGLQALVTRLLNGDESAVATMAQHGASAASLLVSQFPGPIKAEQDRLGGPELASEKGPVLRALAQIGQPAAPFLAVRSNDSDPVVRAWATRLLGEIPSADAAHAIARRVADAHQDVRRAALEAGKLLRSDEEARTALRDRVLWLAEEGSSSIDGRVAAIEALAHFRDGRSVPRLIRLASGADEIAQSAQWALGVITRQSFGRDTESWDAWWADHGERHRIEWLIDSLMHDDADIRRAAGEELKITTKEYFGYYDDLSKSERAKAQRRYREWWEATGKARFSAT